MNSSSVLVIYEFFSRSFNIPSGLSAYEPQKLVVYCLRKKFLELSFAWALNYSGNMISWSHPFLNSPITWRKSFSLNLLHLPSPPYYYNYIKCNPRFVISHPNIPYSFCKRHNYKLQPNPLTAQRWKVLPSYNLTDSGVDYIYIKKKKKRLTFWITLHHFFSYKSTLAHNSSMTQNSQGS